MNLSPAGALTSTTVAAAGTYHFTLRATNTVSTATQAFTLMILAPPSQLRISPASIDFGTVQRYLLIPRVITVKNTGTQKVQFTHISITRGTGTDSHTFTLVNGCGSSLMPGKICALALGFYANIDGAVSGSIDFTDTASGSPQHVPLSATVIDPQPKFSAIRLDFGTQKVNSSTTKTIVLKNGGTTPLLIHDIRITGNNPSDFSQSNHCPASLGPNGSCTISVTFTPKAKTSRSACLTVLDNAWLGSQTVVLTGKGK